MTFKINGNEHCMYEILMIKALLKFVQCTKIRSNTMEIKRVGDVL